MASGWSGTWDGERVSGQRQATGTGNGGTRATTVKGRGIECLGLAEQSA